MSVRPSRPSRLWYWVAGAAVAGSVVWLVLGFVLWLRSASEQVETFQRVPIPGRAEVSFDEAGGYTVYFEGLGADDETATLPAFRVSITPVGGGAEVPVRPYGGSELYNMAELTGRAIGTFEIEEPGRFLVQTAGEPQAVPANVAIGRGVTRTLFLTLPGFLILFLGGVAMAVIVAVRRSRVRGPQPASATLAGRGRRALRLRGGSPTRAGATSSATGTGGSGPSMFPTAAPKGSIPFEPLAPRTAGDPKASPAVPRPATQFETAWGDRADLGANRCPLTTQAPLS